MIVDDKLIERLSSLCYLSVTPDQLPTVRTDIASMIGWMSTISHLDCSNIEPIYTPLQILNETITLHSDIDGDGDGDNGNARLRSDVVDRNQRINVTEHATQTDRGFIVVPKVVDIDE